jgi:hypothetical protein
MMDEEAMYDLPTGDIAGSKRTKAAKDTGYLHTTAEVEDDGVYDSATVPHGEASDSDDGGDGKPYADPMADENAIFDNRDQMDDLEYDAENMNTSQPYDSSPASAPAPAAGKREPSVLELLGLVPGVQGGVGSPVAKPILDILGSLSPVPSVSEADTRRGSVFSILESLPSPGPKAAHGSLSPVPSVSEADTRPGSVFSILESLPSPGPKAAQAPSMLDILGPLVDPNESFGWEA